MSLEALAELDDAGYMRAVAGAVVQQRCTAGVPVHLLWACGVPPDAQLMRFSIACIRQLQRYLTA